MWFLKGAKAGLILPFLFVLFVIVGAKPFAGPPSLQAQEAGEYKKFMVRLRGIRTGGDVDIDQLFGWQATADFENNILPELGFTYFFTRNLAIEISAPLGKKKIRTRKDAFVEAGVAYANCPAPCTPPHGFIRNLYPSLY